MKRREKAVKRIKPVKAVKKEIKDKKPLLSEEEIHTRISQRAYQYFTERNYEHGFDLDDWLKAEESVKKDLGI